MWVNEQAGITREEASELMKKPVNEHVEPISTASGLTQPSKENTRVTVVETVYYQLPDEDAKAIDHGFTRYLKSDEQPYERRLKVGEQWQKLDFHWALPCGLLLLVNSPPQQQAENSEEQQKLRLQAIIQVRLIVASEGFTDGMKAVPHILIPPDENSRFYPNLGVEIWVRCAKGQTRCHIHALPE